MNPLSRVREMVGDFGWFDVSRSSDWSWRSFSLRGFFRTANFFRRPRAEGTTIDFALARSLYRNDEYRFRYGGGFVRPIVDLPVEYMGLPSVSGTQDDAFLNECIRDYWAPQLQQGLRDAIRDSKAVVRFTKPRIDNKLFTSSDRDHGGIEVVPPELAEITYDATDKNMVSQAIFYHEIKVDERTAEEVAMRRPPRMRVHKVVETVTPTSYDFYDETAGAPLTTWNTRNVDGFVPVWEIYNEYSADLGGGQSDIEACMAFIEAFHDVCEQTLTAHQQHSIPKTKFSVKSVDSFIANNWPDAVDPETQKIREGATINWEGHEILFFAPDEDADFIEAVSVLGDSKSLLDFLITCICVSAEIPRWALLADDVASNSSASAEPFKKKIERKRVQFRELFVMTCKMALASANKVPATPKLHWQPVLLEDLASKGQSLQQLILGLDVATAHGWMADETAVKILCALFSEMNAPEVEMELAKDNVLPAAPPAPASKTQALPPPAPSTNGNGGANKQVVAAAVKQLATTSSSRS